MTTVVVESGATDVEPALTLDGPDAVGAVVVVAEHFVQIVDVEVNVTVDTVLVGTVMVDPPVVIVLVTGQVVTVVYVTTVVVDSSGIAEVEPALTLDGPDAVGTGLGEAEVEEEGLILVEVGPAAVDAEEVGPAEAVVSLCPDELEEVLVPDPGVAVAVHLVQIVDVDVKVTVETMLEGTVIVDPPVVIVFVTGQVVTVVYVTTVVVDSPAGAEVEPAPTLDGTDAVGTRLEDTELEEAEAVSVEVDPAGIDAAEVDTAEGIGPPEPDAAEVGLVPGTVVTPAEHLVQIVEVEVIVTVEIVLDVVTM